MIKTIRTEVKKPSNKLALYRFMKENKYPIIHDDRIWNITHISVDVLPLDNPPNTITMDCQMVYFPEKKPKIYISGQITGLDIQEASDIFQATEDILIQCGWDVINPMSLKHDHDQSWESYMKEDIKALMDCDAVLMLPNWVNSKGAKVENDIAKSLNITVFYQESPLWHPKPEDLLNFE